MTGVLWSEILQAAAVLVALVVILDLVTARLALWRAPARALFAGVATGVLGVAVMLTPFQWAPGVVFDARSVLLSVAALFFGAGAGGVALVITAGHRLGMGGDGALTGVLVIIASVLLGLLWRRWLGARLAQIRSRDLLALGVVVHVVMMALMLTLPATSRTAVLAQLTMPVLVVFPLATVALGLLLAGRLQREDKYRRLGESERRYRGLFEHNAAVILIVDRADGRIADANPAAVAFYGWSRDELCVRRLADLIADGPAHVTSRDAAATDTSDADAADDAGSVEAWSAVVAGSGPGRVRLRHRLASGLIRDVDVTSGNVPVDGRDFAYLIIHDVTTERIASDALRLRSAALEAVANALVITDRQGIIEWVNPAFTELYGYTAEDAVGRTPGELMKSGSHDVAFYRELWDTILAGRTWRGRVTNRRRDGTMFEEEMAITPLFDAYGGIAHFIAVKQDLSAWLEMEARLALGQKLETVGRLAGGVAHDFNNILTVINGTLDLVLHELPPDHPSRGDLDEVRQAGDRAAVLTRQLLAFGRRQLRVPEMVGLNDIIAGMMSMLRRLIGEDIRVELDLARDLAPIYADAGQIEQVFLNLMVNARDAMPGGGTITVVTRNVEPDAVRLVVRDTGTGIDRAIVNRIFDPFFTTKPEGAGSGLGLATLYGIVAQYGGTVNVESPPGSGAAFEIVLPRSRRPAPPPAREDDISPEQTPAATTINTGVTDAGVTDAAADHGGMPKMGAVEGDVAPVILVVEDDDAIRRVAGRALQRGGYSVITAASGAEALAMLAAEPRVRLLFTDVVMPGMSGPELARRATSLRPNLRVVLASGYTDDSLERHGVHEAGHAFLEKPYSVTSLVNVVAEALG